ncbi:NAD-dependent epimerase/dehydratase family protein [Glaesserella parasuis]|nr:NAD-dependent epimerase/dehydratase family protein [Glaesserella parasuis]
MKKVLITGKYSYIGSSVECWLSRCGKYAITTLDIKNADWVYFDFSEYDTVFHVAGIAHLPKQPSKQELYKKVNTFLTIDVAKKAKAEGVKQFIFTSTMSVYSGSKLVDNVIFSDTIPLPNEIYGESKWYAEQGLSQLADDKSLSHNLCKYLFLR